MSDEPHPAQDEQCARRWNLSRRVLIVFAALLSFGCCFGTGLGLGVMIGEQNRYTEQYRRERGLVEPILAGDPAFAGVDILPRSNGGICLIGDVPAHQDFARLREALTRAVGEPRAEEILIAVGPRP